MAIFALKQTVDFYRNQDTPVYMCFLDAKKAFDRVNHWTLAKKLLDRGVPLHIVELFIFWYREQEFMVRWGNSLSVTFRCSNGIRQGGQLKSKVKSSLAGSPPTENLLPQICEGNYQLLVVMLPK